MYIPKELYVNILQKYLTSVFIVILLKALMKWIQPRCSSADKWIKTHNNKQWNSCRHNENEIIAFVEEMDAN